mmetsp:Transcript_5342/g.12877  ORF Transcript_5342/g.12877 Transcript_5342/m.12877 type:complete len:214 (-) Transcript_5342:79-720(-)
MTWLLPRTLPESAFGRKADSIAEALDGLRPLSVCLERPACSAELREVVDDVPEDEVPEICAQALDRRLRQLRRRSAQALLQSAAPSIASMLDPLQPAGESAGDSTAFWLGTSGPTSSPSSDARASVATSSSGKVAPPESQILPPCLRPQSGEHSCFAPPKPVFSQRSERTQGSSPAPILKRSQQAEALLRPSKVQRLQRSKSSTCCAAADEAA